jgi:hypothetical protein
MYDTPDYVAIRETMDRHKHLSVADVPEDLANPRMKLDHSSTR